MPKAGSTALQQAFAGARDALGRRGILYPRAPHFQDSQNFLVAGLEERRHALPRMIRSAYDGRMEEVGPDFARWLESIRAKAASSRPETLVLSSEWLFALRGASKFDRLGALLAPLGAPIEVVAYVRRPSDQYLSAIQQTLKGSHVIRPPAAVRYRTPLEGFARIAGRVHVVRYDRDAFPGGDIVRHFVTAFLPKAAGALATSGERSANTTISAEGMAILAGYRRVNHRRSRGRFTADTDRLIEAIRAADAAIGGDARPRLLPEVRAAVDGASEDVLWLRDTHGIVFDGLDYDRVAAVPPPQRVVGEDGRRRKVRPDGVEAICAVDPERRQDLTMRVMHALADTERATPAAPLRGVSLWLRGRARQGRR
jgi:hypothetical protein